MSMLPCGRSEICCDNCLDKVNDIVKYNRNYIENCYHTYRERERNYVETSQGIYLTFKQADYVKSNGISKLLDKDNFVRDEEVICPSCQENFGKLLYLKKNQREEIVCNFCDEKLIVKRNKTTFTTRLRGDNM